MPGSGDIVVRGVAPGVAEVVIDHPRKRNALTTEMTLRLARAVGEEASRPGAKALVLRGSGGVFTSGADLDGLDDLPDDALGQYAAGDGLDAAFGAIAASSVPVVARVEGFAVGAGLALIAASTYAVAASTARLSLPEARLGVFPAAVVPLVARRVGLDRAIWWALTARELTAEEARSAGLIDEVVDPQRLEARLDELVGDLKGTPDSVVRAAMALRRRLMDAQGLTQARDAGRLVGAMFWSQVELRGGLARRRG